MIDNHLVLEAYLKQTGTTLYGLVGTRVYPPPGNPRPIAKTTAVSFEQLGGNRILLGVSWEGCIYTIAAWGTYPAQARQVARAVSDLLHDVSRQDVTISGSTYRISYTRRQSGLSDSPDFEDSSIWACEATYEIVMRRETV